jgi:hypothetical protein
VDRRLLALSALVLAATAAPELPAAGVLLSLALPVAGVAGAAVSGPAGGLLVLAPGAGMLAVRGPEALPAFLASGLAGTVLGTLVRRGAPPARALAWGALPLATWAVGLALSGFDPVPPEMADAFRRLLAAEMPGGAPPALGGDPDAAIGLVRRTWVGAEVMLSAAALALAYRIAARLFAERAWPPFAPFVRFDLPDALVAALLAGLVAVYAAQNGAPSAAASLGGNLLLAAALLYAVRGVAIQAFWLARAGLGPRASAALLLAGALVLLPVFPVAAAGLGLFDTWFDFRRFRDPERGNHPLSFRHSSSDDGT